MEKTKRYIKNDFTCVVSVYLDKEYKYDRFEDIPTDSEGFTHHEFEDFGYADEYCKILLEMNKDFIGRFLYNVRYIPIKASENFTNKIEFYQLNMN